MISQRSVIATAMTLAAILQAESCCAQSVFAQPGHSTDVLYTQHLPQETFAPPPIEEQPLWFEPAGDVVEEWTWQALPAGLLWHSYAAAPKEPRFATVFLYDQNGNWYWDSTLGGRVGLLRYGTVGTRHASGLQWDLEGAAMPRLDMLHAQDLESVDFRIGTQLTAAQGPWSFKFGYFHLSSHVGDEYLVRFPAFERVNYVTESAVLGISLQATDELRTYGEAAYAFHRDGGAGRWQVQTGFEYALIPRDSLSGAPFVAANLDLRESVDFDPALNVLAGWQWKGVQSAHTLRMGVQYSNGKSSQYEFFQRRDEQLGLGVWFDY